MTVFTIEPETGGNWHWLVPASARDWARIDALEGRNVGDSWSPLECRVVRDDLTGQAEMGDYPLLSKILPVFSEKAIKCLSELLRGNVEVLAIECEGQRFYGCRIVTMCDCFDERRSECRTFTSGRIMQVKKLVLKKMPALKPDIFRVPQLPKGPTLVSHRLREAAAISHLRGMKFEPVPEE